MHCKKLLEEHDYLNGLFLISHYPADIIRPVEDWERNSYNAEKQFSDLLRHLFCKYDVPVFMDHAWLPDGKGTERRWFISIGSGNSVRDTPGKNVQITKKIAHLFMQAPSYCTIPEALRRAQVLAMGGTEEMAWYVCRSSLCRNNFEEESFWQTVIRFFAAVPMFDFRHFDEIVDYITHCRRTQLSFSMKGRTAEALLRQTLEWHAELNLAKSRTGKIVWNPCNINGFKYEEGVDFRKKVYRITELLSSDELSEEGKVMHHCVSTYARSCHAGRTAIFSLTVESMFDHARLVTIELNRQTRTIVQVKGKYNAPPKPKDMELISRWLANTSVKLSKWLSA